VNNSLNISAGNKGRSSDYNFLALALCLCYAWRMPRKSRIDAPGALHHVIVRGIERKKIFKDDTDRDKFLERLGLILADSGTACLAWSLIPNHYLC